MSGIEAAGLVIGVIPVLLKVISCYETTRETFRSIASSSTGVKRLHIRFKTQESIFRNECRHILLMVIDYEQSTKMIQDFGCDLWHDTHVDGQLRILLGGESHGVLISTLKEIGKMLVEVQDVLTHCFGKLLQQVSLHSPSNPSNLVRIIEKVFLLLRVADLCRVRLLVMCSRNFAINSSFRLSKKRDAKPV
jgi:hypothetical protein